MQDRWYQGKGIFSVCQDLGIGCEGRVKGASLIAPTGAGKTWIMARVIQEIRKANPNASILVVAHMSDLIVQNKAAIEFILGESIGVWQGPRKDNNRILCAMAQTIQSQGITDSWDYILYDEGHHAPAPENAAFIEAARSINPDLRLLVVTATPVRADGKRLSDVGVETCSYSIHISVLIEEGTLVKPLPFVQDIGAYEIASNRRGWTGLAARDPEMEKLMAKDVSKRAVFNDWVNNCEGRRTIMFCSSTKESDEYADYFRRNGVGCYSVHSKMSAEDQANIKAAHKRGEFPVLASVYSLVEGYDDPLVSCVILVRNIGSESALIQAVGRGLRSVDPKKYPGVIKNDCLIRDFSASLANNPDIFTKPVATDAKPKRPGGGGEAPKKDCKCCGFENHAAARECSNCGELFPIRVKAGETVLDEVELVPLDMLKRKSKYRWEEIGEDLVAAQTFEGGIVYAERTLDGWDAWHSTDNGQSTHIGTGKQSECVSILERYLKEKSGKVKGTSTKKAAWHRAKKTEKQRSLIARMGGDNELANTSYRASLLIGWLFSKKGRKR